MTSAEQEISLTVGDFLADTGKTSHRLGVAQDFLSNNQASFKHEANNGDGLHPLRTIYNWNRLFFENQSTQIRKAIY
jgi:hypothetical protein